MSTLSFLVVLSALFFNIVFAQEASIVYPTTAAPSATIVPNLRGYTYAGCWNETTYVPGTDGARALQNGMSSNNNTLTVESCIDFCVHGPNGTSAQYAGIEYGRECYCGQYVSTFSEKLNESAHCIFACNGNSSEICGGRNAITLYNLTDISKTGVAWSLGGGAAWYGTAAVATLLIAALL